MRKIGALFEVIMLMVALVGATVILSNYASALDIKMGKTSGRVLLPQTPPEEISSYDESSTGESSSEEYSSEDYIIEEPILPMHINESVQ